MGSNRSCNSVRLRILFLILILILIIVPVLIVTLITRWRLCRSTIHFGKASAEILLMAIRSRTASFLGERMFGLRLVHGAPTFGVRMVIRRSDLRLGGKKSIAPSDRERKEGDQREKCKRLPPPFPGVSARHTSALFHRVGTLLEWPQIQ